MKNGPMKDRSCTDIICCLIFIAFIAGMVITSGYGLTKGDPEILLTTWDADKNACGSSAPTKDYPLLYFPTIDLESVKEASSDPNLDKLSDILKFGTCVKTCPSDDKNSKVECKPPKYMDN